MPWGQAGNIRGPAGPTGATGATGATGPPGPEGSTVPIEAWREVGAAGQPAFLNGFSNFSSTTATPIAFRKRPDGLVEFRGMGNAPAIAAGGALAMFTLPEGYRPTGPERFVGIHQHGPAFMRVDPDGNVLLFNLSGYTGTGSAGFFDIGVLEVPTNQSTFPSGPKGDSGPGSSSVPMEAWRNVGASGQPAFLNAWAAYGQGNALPSFRKDPTGKVELRGLLSSGTNGTNAFVLPAGYRPAATLHFASQHATGTTFVRVDNAGGVFIAGGAGNWVDISTVEFDTETVNAFPTGPKGDKGDVGPLGRIVSLSAAASHAFVIDGEIARAVRLSYNGRLTNGGADRLITVRPNDSGSEWFSTLEHRAGHDGTNFFHDIQRREGSGFGFYCGGAFWPANSAASIVSGEVTVGIRSGLGVQRQAHGRFTTDPDFLNARQLGGSVHGTWENASRFIKGLTLDFGGGAFTGDVLLEELYT